MSEHKALTGVTIKDADKGTVEAVFATLGVADHDGDVTVKGAFSDGAAVTIGAYGHSSWDGMLPVGRGTIHERGDEAVLDGRLFVTSTVGRDHFETLKEMGPLMQWSYGFDVRDSEQGDLNGERVRFLKRLDVHEVSPVLLGAGVATRTLAVKSDTDIRARSSFPDEVERVLGDMRGLVDRVHGWGQGLDAKDGQISAANRERLQGMTEALGEACKAFKAMLAESDPENDRELLIRQFAKFQHLLATIN